MLDRNRPGWTPSSRADFARIMDSEVPQGDLPNSDAANRCNGWEAALGDQVLNRSLVIQKSIAPVAFHPPMDFWIVENSLLNAIEISLTYRGVSVCD